MNSHILSLLVFIPILGALVTLAYQQFKPKSVNGNNDNGNAHKWIAAVTTGLQLLLAAWLYIQYIPTAGIQFVEQASWIPNLILSITLVLTVSVCQWFF